MDMNAYLGFPDEDGVKDYPSAPSPSSPAASPSPVLPAMQAQDTVTPTLAESLIPAFSHGNTGSAGGPGRPMHSLKASDKMTDWHKQLADYIISHPGAKRQDMADYFEVTKEWVSRVKNSDLFMTYFETRLKEHQKLVSEQIAAKAGHYALTALGVMERRVSTQGDQVSMGDLTRSAEMAGKMLGMGVAVNSSSVNPGITINTMGVSAELLAKAREKMELMGAKNSLDLSQEEVKVVSYDEDEDAIARHDADLFAEREVSNIDTLEDAEVVETEKDKYEGEQENELISKAIANSGWKGMDAPE